MPAPTVGSLFTAYITRLMESADAERHNMFVEGDILSDGVQPKNLALMGFPSKEDFYRAVGSEIGMSRRTQINRIKVATTFGDDVRDYPLRWGVFLVAAETDTPRYWLDIAHDEALSKEALKDRIKLATGTMAAEVRRVLSTAPAHVVDAYIGDTLRRVIMLKDQADEDRLADSYELQVTAFEYVQSVAQEADV
jgi:hypothetical protein